MYINEERVTELMQKLKLTRQEAIDVISYDEDVNKNKATEYDLTEEQRENVKDIMRKTEHRKSGNRVSGHRPNETKEAIIIELAEFLREDAQGQAYEDVEITNANRMIHFSIGEKEFDLQLIEKRAKKK
jgi:hypothetical protein